MLVRRNARLGSGTESEGAIMSKRGWRKEKKSRVLTTTCIEEPAFFCLNIKCAEGFKTYSDFQQHRRQCKKIKHIQCKICHKTYANQTNLDIHMRLHAGGDREQRRKQNRCPICDKGLADVRDIIFCHQIQLLNLVRIASYFSYTYKAGS